MCLQKSQNGVTSLGAGISQFDPNREVGIGLTHASTIIEFLTLFIVLFLFIKIRDVSETGLCLCPQVNAYSVEPNR
jgi:hypothetical protein